jgi:hypothetical protein
MDTENPSVPTRAQSRIAGKTTPTNTRGSHTPAPVASSTTTPATPPASR